MVELCTGNRGTRVRAEKVLAWKKTYRKCAHVDGSLSAFVRICIHVIVLLEAEAELRRRYRGASRSRSLLTRSRTGGCVLNSRAISRPESGFTMNM